MASTMQMVKDLTLALSKNMDTYRISELKHCLERRESISYQILCLADRNVFKIILKSRLNQRGTPTP